MSESDLLRKTVLHPAHLALGARMTPFGGYDMPVQYPDGVLVEHRWTRDQAGLFDVSHMGPCFLTLDAPSGDPEADHAAVSALIEPLISGDIAGLKPGQLRYTVLLNETGGMIDDLMIGRPRLPERQGRLYIVVNAGTKDHDFSLIAAAAAGRATLTRADDRALVALQGPAAEAVLATLFPEAADLSFMTFRRFDRKGEGFVISRSGYSGEDGYEILIPAAQALEVWDLLTTDPRVKPVGLGARDSLRLEAGLPLYGHDADETISPVEAGLAFAVAKKRRTRGDLRGAERLARELSHGPARIRVGLRVLSGAPAREGAEIADATGTVVGRVTSGGPSPSLGFPIAMGFVPPSLSAVGTSLQVIVRGRSQPAEVVAMPFVPHRYVRKA